ncbi:hypothetical protein IGB42_02623 [Andreprevotia sp. IGB-42]|uniref:WD40/YVTN/BNR-like repeat-containing protein n=1 Tax=Andreprevotia sp. IGB-42 TaxID=2497473 RepID=UPI00135CCA7C|nr:hypothetical protein [Andreprevotia sp. IGB-42]KAF0812780.1 hypothetical protein IGB42_02623 [Andreprevotia sp. IGB-42]
MSSPIGFLNNAITLSKKAILDALTARNAARDAIEVGQLVGFPIVTPPLYIAGGATYLRSGVLATEDTAPNFPPALKWIGIGTWIAVAGTTTTMGATSISGVAIGGDTVILIGASAKVARSTDRAGTFAAVTLPGAGSVSLHSVATDGAGTWIIVSASTNTRLWRSADDGATWTELTVMTGFNAQFGIKFAGGKFILLSSAQFASAGAIRHSTDGLSWTNSPAVAGASIAARDVASDDAGNWLFVGTWGASGSGVLTGSAGLATFSNGINPDVSSVQFESVAYDVSYNRFLITYPNGSARAGLASFKIGNTSISSATGTFPASNSAPPRGIACVNGVAIAAGSSTLYVAKPAATLVANYQANVGVLTCVAATQRLAVGAANNGSIYICKPLLGIPTESSPATDMLNYQRIK